MQNVVIDKPYTFIPPSRNRWWPRLMQFALPWRLRKEYGITQVECHGGEKIVESIKAGSGVLIAPNHCRPCDPEVIHDLCRRFNIQPHIMASWHLFMQSRLQSWILSTGGAFSIYREGLDRAALNMAIEILEQGDRPLVIFPEGSVTRTNDRVNPLLEGTAFIARSAAKKRAKRPNGGQVVVHPTALRYRYGGEVRETVEPVLTEIERRLSWRPQSHLSLEQRIAKVGYSLLTLKEIEYFGQPQTGTIAERTARLIDRLLSPIEQEWLAEPEAHVVARVKKLRTAMLPGLVQGELTEAERERRWHQLADMYLAQQISCYPPDYLEANPTADRLLETVERFEEDLTDRCRPHAPLHVTVTVGDAIPVATARERGDAEDALMIAIDHELNRLLGIA